MRGINVAQPFAGVARPRDRLTDVVFEHYPTIAQRREMVTHGPHNHRLPVLAVACDELSTLNLLDARENLAEVATKQGFLNILSAWVCLFSCQNTLLR